MDTKVRCQWAVRYPELIPYHDQVWGVPTHDDRAIFAAYGQCILHAGLLWTALLKKRQLFEQAFDGWDIKKVAAYDGAEVERLVTTEGMIRNFQKINSIINNAQRILEVQKDCGCFAEYLWRFTDGETVPDDHRAQAVAEKLAADLKRRGFKFSGPATAYGLMEDIGLTNSHDPACFRYAG